MAIVKLIQMHTLRAGNELLDFEHSKGPPDPVYSGVPGKGWCEWR